MRKVTLLTILVISLSLIGWFGFAEEVDSQSCTGSYVCGQSRSLCSCGVVGGTCSTDSDCAPYSCNCSTSCVYAGQGGQDWSPCSWGNGCNYPCTDCGQGGCSSGSTPPPDGNGGGGGPSPTCEVDLTPDSPEISLASSLTFTASVTNIQDGTVDRVDFSSDNETVATVDPASDTTVVYETDVTGETLGTANIRVDVIMNGVSRCIDTSTAQVVIPGPWWQAIDADIVATGNITSIIPGICSGGCIPTLILDGAGGYPGIPFYGGSLAVGQGNVSSTGWEANSSYNDPREYKYAYFDRKIPADATIDEIETPSVDGSEITSGGTEYDGYYWYHFDGDTYGDLTITSDVNIASDRKVILFVESADLYLQGNVAIQNDGEGFLLVVVGETEGGSKGNIYVDSGVSGTDDGVPEIEGLFMADNAFETGTAGVDGDNQLHIRGSVAAYGGISLDRDLADDSQTPAEIFEYAPELMLLFPKSLGLERMRWEEVAP